MPDPNPTLFATTRWTIVLEAAQGQETAAVDALGTLVHTYWQPLYRYARRKGKSEHDAEDLVQGFLTHILEHQALQGVDQARGRFRAFLLATFNHYMINEWKHANRQKRGGGTTILSVDWQSAETGLQLEPADDKSPDKLFDREWALALLAKVLDDLENNARLEGNEEQFKTLRSSLTTDSQKVPYANLAEQLNMSEGAIRVAVHRLRKRYRKALEEEIARTLPGPEAVKDEMEALFSALS